MTSSADESSAVRRPWRVGGTVRARLVMLVVALVVPGVLVSTLLLNAAFRHGQDLARRQLMETARALSLVVDGQIGQYRILLQSLAASAALRQGDLAAFHAEAARAADGLAGIQLMDSDGEQMLHTRLPYGAQLPNARVAEDIAWTRLPDIAVSVSSMFTGATSKQRVFSIRMPVVVGGRALELCASIPVAALADILRNQHLPENWLGSVLDQRSLITARSRDPADFIGRRAGEQIMAIVAAGGGVAETVSLDGVPSLTAVARSPLTGWTFVVAMPRKEVMQLATRSLTWGVPASFALLTFGVMLAVLVARSITRPVDTLTGCAAALGRGEPVQPAVTGLDELDGAGRALSQAAAELHRRESAWRELNATLEARVDQRTGALIEANEKLRREIAERAETEERLRQAQKMEAVGQLTGGVAHDFNNLLQALTGCLQLVGRRTGDRAEIAPILQAGRQAIDRGAKLVQQLMAFARRQALNPEPVDVRDRVLAMSDLLARALRADIRLDVQIAAELWPIEVDATQFELAILNLVVNARDAMPAGGSLRITAENSVLLQDPRGLSGSFVHLRVTDNGSGMEPEVAARAFDPFFTTKGVGKGSGLGLSQVYGFVQQSGGTVWIDSEPRRGTIVHLLLPRADAMPVATVVRTAVQVDSRRGGRVLMVEDEPVVATTVAAALEDAGYSVVCAATADEALALAAGDRFDLLFSDVVMPGWLSGIDLARELQCRHPGLPVVLTTGYSEDVARLEGVQLLPKPYRIDELIQALDAALLPAAGAAA